MQVFSVRVRHFAESCFEARLYTENLANYIVLRRVGLSL